MSEDFEVSKELIKQLVDGTIDDDNAEKTPKAAEKDKKRFFNYIEVLQKSILER